MDERIRFTPENQQSPGNHETSKQHEQPAGHAEGPKHEQETNIEHLRQLAQNKATSARELPRKAEDKHHRPPLAFVNKELKEMAYQRNLIRARRHFSKTGRMFSRFIHQPVINSLSEAGAKTVGRPSGLLGAGIVALIGTSSYYFITKYYGFEYNYTVFLLLLLAGLILGWILETLYRLIRR